MEFIYQKQEVAGEALGDSLMHALDKHSRVLWLVPGGSNIALASAVMNSLPEPLTARLHIMLTDERFGAPGHPDSNYQQLMEAGFDPKQATFIPVLRDGKDMVTTATEYDQAFENECNDAGFIVALFGIGPDSHIAGILPGSPASSSEAAAVGYKGEAFDRITLTFPSLRRIDVAFAGVFGDAKREALQKLHDRSADLGLEPCQILREIPESYVYNDCIAGEAVTS